MRRYDGMCPKCGVRPRPTKQHPYCRPCAAEAITERRGGRKRQPRERNWTSQGMECSKAPPPPDGFNPRDLDLGRPYA